VACLGSPERAIARSSLHKPLQNDYFAGVLLWEMELDAGARP